MKRHIKNWFRKISILKYAREVRRLAQISSSKYYLYRPYLIKKGVYHIDKRLAFSDKYNFCYIRLPKCANSTIVATLDHYIPEDGKTSYKKEMIGNVKSKYKNPTNLEYKKLNKILEKGFVFSVVRNPYDRVLSAYLDKFRFSKYKKRYGKEIKKYGKKGITFLSFCKWLKDGGWWRDPHWMPQYRFIEAIGEENVGFIGKVESLSQDIQKIANGIGIDRTVRLKKPKFDPDRKKEHKTRAKKKVKKFHNSETKKIISDLYEKDFEIFDYEI